MALQPSQADSSIIRRIRSSSNRLGRIGDKLRRSRSRSNDDRPESIVAFLRTAGVISGTLGSPFVDPEKQEQKPEQEIDQDVEQAVKDGTLAFMQELERVASPPQSDLGLQRTGTLKLEPNIEVEHGVHPITSADENPFEADKDDSSITSKYDFTEDILVVNRDAKVFMRALLDTGMGPNAIHLDAVERSGFAISKYTGCALRDADGPEVEVLGKVMLQFHFTTYRSARTWTLEFVVLRDPPFDVAFGKKFIKQAGLLKRSDVVLPLGYKHQTKEDKERQDQKTRDANARNPAEIEQEKADYAARTAAKRKNKEKKSR